MCACIHLCIYACVCLYVCANVCMYVCVSVCLYLCMFVCACMYVRTNLCIDVLSCRQHSMFEYICIERERERERERDFCCLFDSSYVPRAYVAVACILVCVYSRVHIGRAVWLRTKDDGCSSGKPLLASVDTWRLDQEDSTSIEMGISA